MKVRNLVEAEREFIEAAARYNVERPGLGDEFLDALSSARTQIADRPRLFPKHDLATRRREFRYALIDRFPYSIIYLVKKGEIVIFAVAHTSREPGYWMRRRS
jgi:plasmid stabilization system protein ParE